jgi:hypothetical protein
MMMMMVVVVVVVVVSMSFCFDFNNKQTSQIHSLSFLHPPLSVLLFRRIVVTGSIPVSFPFRDVARLSQPLGVEDTVQAK